MSDTICTTVCTSLFRWYLVWLSIGCVVASWGSVPLCGQTPRSLEELLKQAENVKPLAVDPLRFALPEVDDAKLVARGIRKLTGKHVVIYTDVPAQAAIDELPHVFDAAVLQWAAYFEIAPEQTKRWQVSACLIREPDKFKNVGLLPADLPQFLHGYMRDGQCWLYDQPSEYYNRHLLLHEGTHAFMVAYLGAFGPPWYAEGMAELLSTHRWEEGKLSMNVVPRSREESLLWGRIKVIRDDWQQYKALSLSQVMSYPFDAYLKTEPYAWSWSAAAFFDHDPELRVPFRELRNVVEDTGPTFATRLWNKVKAPRQVQEQWQWFLGNLDYGYDIEREKILRRDAQALPATGGKVSILAERGWQSSGWQLEAGKTYEIEARGRFQIANQGKVMPFASHGHGLP